MRPFWPQFSMFSVRFGCWRLLFYRTTGIKIKIRIRIKIKNCEPSRWADHNLNRALNHNPVPRMNSLTDQQLLRDYTGRRSEAAFAELVRRHVDFVYSAALRMVRDAHLAEDVAQGVFVALAQSASQLRDRPVLSGWLHRTTQNLAANAVRTNVRRQAREQEAAAMNELLAAGSDVSWEHIAPHLDAALGELSEPDRDAVLLRYFEKKSAQEMAERLGISDEAAQKRVSRAVERLREFFAKRGVAIGASGLVVVISANAVQAAPAGLAITISTAVVLTGTTLATTAT